MRRGEAALCLCLCVRNSGAQMWWSLSRFGFGVWTPTHCGGRGGEAPECGVVHDSASHAAPCGRSPGAAEARWLMNLTVITTLHLLL